MAHGSITNPSCRAFDILLHIQNCFGFNVHSSTNSAKTVNILYVNVILGRECGFAGQPAGCSVLHNWLLMQGVPILNYLFSIGLCEAASILLSKVPLALCDWLPSWDCLKLHVILHVTLDYEYPNLAIKPYYNVLQRSLQSYKTQKAFGLFTQHWLVKHDPEMHHLWHLPKSRSNG